MNKTIAALVACGALATSIRGDIGAEPLTVTEPLTLMEAVNRVRNAGFDVRTSVEAARIAQADARTARAGLRPQLSVSGNALDDNVSQLGMPIASQAYVSLYGSIPIYTPSTGPSARAAVLSATAAGTDVNVARNDAYFATVQAYRRAQLAQAVYGTRQANVRDQQDHLKTTEQRERAGKMPRYLLARDRARLAAAEQSLEDADADRVEAANDLAEVLDLNVAAPPQIATPLDVTTFDGTVDQYVTRALAQRPSVVAASQRIDAARRIVAATLGAYRPSATLSAQSYNGNSSPYLGRSGGGVAFVASLPLVDGGARSAAIDRARATLSQAQIVSERERLSTERDVRNAFRELQAAQSNLGTAQAGARNAEEELRIARIRAAAGKAIDLEILDALAVSAAARETVVRSVARYDIAVALVHHAAGDLTL